MIPGRLCTDDSGCRESRRFDKDGGGVCSIASWAPRRAEPDGSERKHDDVAGRCLWACDGLLGASRGLSDYPSTRNPHHLRPASVGEIGHDGPANHQYDMSDFAAALQAHKLPAVSYLKAPAYQDEHPGNSDPLSAQTFLVGVINALQQSRNGRIQR
jgi:hypothetical protein